MLNAIKIIKQTRHIKAKTDFKQFNLEQVNLDRP